MAEDEDEEDEEEARVPGTELSPRTPRHAERLLSLSAYSHPYLQGHTPSLSPVSLFNPSFPHLSGTLYNTDRLRSTLFS